MTPISLLDALAEFVHEHTKNMLLQTRGHEISEDEREPDGERSAYIYKMRLPDEFAEVDNIPYILLQLLTGRDVQTAFNDPQSECRVRIVVATYSSDYSKGAMDVLNIVTRLRTALLNKQLIGEQFQLKTPLEYNLYTEDYAPYFLGDMITNWFITPIYREWIEHYPDSYPIVKGDNDFDGEISKQQ